MDDLEKLYKEAQKIADEEGLKYDIWAGSVCVVCEKEECFGECPNYHSKFHHEQKLKLRRLQ